MSAGRFLLSDAACGAANVPRRCSALTRRRSCGFFFIQFNVQCFQTFPLRFPFRPMGPSGVRCLVSKHLENFLLPSYTDLWLDSTASENMINSFTFGEVRFVTWDMDHLDTGESMHFAPTVGAR